MEILIPSKFATDRNNVLNELYEMRDEIQNRDIFVPEYNSDLDFYSSMGFNCYCYAMQFTKHLTSEEKKDYPFYEPGFLSGEFTRQTDNEKMIRAFLADCDFLGINAKEVSCEEISQSDAYKISIYIQTEFLSDENPSTPKFHLIRQNSDSSWSHKEGWFRNPERTMNAFKRKSLTRIKTYEISRRK